MRAIRLSVLLVACGSHPEVASRVAPHPRADIPHPPPVTAACMSARDVRASAATLHTAGHELLARAKLDEANASCPAEKASSADLDKAIADALSNDVPSKGTAPTMRAKLREAYAAERAKDWPKAKGLYLDAWAENHPLPRALEDAARMAGLAGDAAESRRLRDRALAEAESTEKGVVQVGTRVHVAVGSARLHGTTLVLGSDGQVVTRDSASGELRVRLDAWGKHTSLSPLGTLALTGPTPREKATLSVYDVLSGALLFTVPNATNYIVSPDDKVLVVSDEDTLFTGTPGATLQPRVFDATTGELKSKLAPASWTGPQLYGFSPDDTHVIVGTNEGGTLASDFADTLRQWDLGKGAATSVKLAAEYGEASTSLDGRFLVYLDARSDTGALHVRDMTTNKEVAQWTAHFHSVDTVDVSSDGKWLATGSYRSLRLWDVAQKKQLFTRAGPETFEVGFPYPYAFSDDSEAMVIAGRERAVRWDVATGKETPLTADPTPKNVLHVVPAPSGVALVLEDEVRIVPRSGETHTVCKGLPQPVWANPTMIGPTSVAFSPSGKLFACAMWDGWVHVLDTSTWAEKAVVKRGAGSTIDRPVDLFFSADDATLTDVSDTGFVVYDAQTAKETKRVVFRHGGQGFAPRHARFDDGTVAVRGWNGTAAIFAADGTWQRDVKLVASAPADALDAFATSGKTYAVALGKTLHVVDLATGDDKTTDLPAKGKSLAVSPDGQTVLVATSTGDVLSVSGGVASPHGKGVRVAFTGTAPLVWSAPAAVGDLELDAGGLVVHDATGAFEMRDKPEVVCVVGKTYLSRITCDDRSKDGLVAAWIDRLK